ncbi:hypothetical protein HFO89_11005 [Rhizobium leguminosarum]|uniref:hypothetical protein n=1 Tax=Rhizobium leguminosarum TaxID=384 RepID=UPI001C95A044|nr:hypothetical protein [Rhizobium leguminosarum]MBY5456888.1 hypothetical protein [Rhizobium leguminosarum]
MSNVFKDSSAPYILVLLLSLVGWMFNSAIDNASKLRIVQYRIESGSDGEVATKTLYLMNRSISGAVSIGSFTLACVLPDGQAGCLAKLPRANVEAQFLKVGNVVLASNPQLAGDNEIAFPALIPPRGEVAYRIGVADSNATIRLRYNVDYDPIKNTQSDLEVVLSEDRPVHWSSWNDVSEHILAFVLGNYISLLFCGIAILSALIGAWLLIELLNAFASLWRGKTDGKATFKVTTGGTTHEVTVEEL